MPTKFKPTEVVVNKQTGKKKTKSHFMHQISNSELMSSLGSSNTTPKKKQKIRNELVRRGKAVS